MKMTMLTGSQPVKFSIWITREPWIRILMACMPFLIGALIGKVSAYGHFRLLFGWSISPGWPLLILLLLIGGRTIFLRGAILKVIISTTLIGVALLFESLGFALHIKYTLIALVGVGLNTAGFVVGLGYNKAPIISWALGIVSTYINSVFFFNLFQCNEFMSFFDGGEII